MPEDVVEFTVFMETHIQPHEWIRLGKPITASWLPVFRERTAEHDAEKLVQLQQELAGSVRIASHDQVDIRKGVDPIRAR